MNDPTKRIDVEKSSLLSLKAELLRKQEEVLKNKKSVPIFVKSNSKKVKDPSKQAESSSNSVGAKVEECEDSALMSRSRKILEAKAKYYDKMMKSKGALNSDDHSLVMFNRKTQIEKDDSDEDEMWVKHSVIKCWNLHNLILRVEYTDCFGRTRKIPRKDLDKVKEQDEDLQDVAESRDQQTDQKRAESKSPKSVGEISDDSNDNESMIGPDVGLQFLKQRDEWQKQEDLNTERPSLHYQDILFDGELFDCFTKFLILFNIPNRYFYTSHVLIA